ncbi:MAG: calcium-binding protein, partial [Octadecabacter sp.]
GKTFQYGYIDENGLFVGVTVKGTDLTYDPVTGLPNGGTLNWMELNHTFATSGLPRGDYKLSNFDETDVSVLATGDINWIEPAGFFELYAIQSAPKLTMTHNQSDFVGSDQNDTIILNALDYSGGFIDGGLGDDTLYGSQGLDSLIGGEGNDTLYGGSRSDVLVGGNGNDTIYGGDYGGGYGGAGDTVYGGAGADRLYGGDDDDLIFGDAEDFEDTGVVGAGNDNIFGGDGRDQIFGHAGDDRLRGDGGDDTIYGGDGADVIYGGDGNDFLAGAGFIASNDPIADLLVTEDSNNKLFGGAGDDFLFGSAADDLLYGGAGDDVIFVSSGDQRAFGGDGNDFIGQVFGGTSQMTGGAGADEFAFMTNETSNATIKDFAVEEDLFAVYFENSTTQQEQYDLFMLGATQANQHLVWTDGNATVVFNNVDIEDLTLDNFIDTPGQVASY